MLRGAALLLTVLTGFSGLVYQVAWQKYLAALLGSHSEATCAVLGIFLGGLSLGYALFGRVSRGLAGRDTARKGRGGQLWAYGWVEAGIGLYALAFPWLFEAVQRLSLRLPHGHEGLAFGLDVGLTALLIGPPTVLMGGTIPLLTQGLSRDLEDATRFHAYVYAFNTVGAFAGALAGGFVLVPQLGLAGTVHAMGLVNLAAGLGFLALHRHEVAGVAPPPAAPRADDTPHGFASYAGVALLAGFAMMTLQTAMNRLGALALGASHFTFSMVVATFVLCIALGSFAVSALHRIGPGHLLAAAWALVAYLLLLYPAMENAPYWAHVVRLQFADPAASFHAFYLVVFVCVLVLFLIPLGLSGALLPLLFHHLRGQVADLGHTAGRLYGWNTVGSLAGALLGGYALLFWLDLHHTYRLAVLALALAAALLSARVLPQRRFAAGVALLAVAGLLAAQPAWRPERLMAGLFRSRLPAELFAGGPDAYFAWVRELWSEGYVRFYDDDPAASVAVVDTDDTGQWRGRSIVTNGKTDGNIPGDDLTQGLLALLPALFAERCERAFVIGYGTGMTVGELAALESTREVKVAEISPAVIEAASLFEDRNRHAIANPKTRVVRGDAYRALLRSDTRWDVIVSEPSNPWVTGVEMLYSVEFLRAARTRLAPGGVYAQWFHTYETDDATVALVLRTFRRAFDRVAVWYGEGTDLILLGFESGDHALDLARLERRAQRPDFARQLADLGVTSFPRLIAHEALPLDVAAGLELPGDLHTLMRPVLSHVAARAFYRHGAGELPPGIERTAAETGARNALVGRLRASRGGVLPAEERLELLRETCRINLTRCATLFSHWLHQEPESPLLADRLARAREDARLAPALEARVLERLAALYGADPTAEMSPAYELAEDLRRVFVRYYHHAAPFRAEALHAVWRRCAGRDPRCADRLDRVLGEGVAPPLLSRR
jgi:predicted membrane-bound spermidine synthase